MAFPESITGKGNEATMVTNLGGTEVESQPLGLDYRASLLPYVSYLPYLPQPIWPFSGGPTKPHTCLSPLLFSVPPDPSPPPSPPPVISRFPLLRGTALVLLIWHLCEGHISAASLVGSWGMPVRLSIP